MGVTRTDLYSEAQNETARLLKAIAHPARIAILEHLVHANACINSDLVEELGLAQATISQHLRELKGIGIIQGSIEGTSVSYCINPTVWNTLQDKLNGFFSAYCPPDNDCC